MNTNTALLMNILDSTPVIATLLSPDREIVWANRMCIDFIGHPIEDITNKKCCIIWHLGDTCPGCPFSEVMTTGNTMSLNLPVPDQRSWPNTNGKWHLNFFPVKEEQGNIYGVMAVAYEVTTENMMRRALMNSESRLRRAEELAHIGHWELELETNELFWSDEVYKIFEIDPLTFGSSYEAFLNASHPDDRQKIHNTYIKSLENKTAYEVEHRLELPDGRIKYVHERCKNYYDHNGRQVRSLGTVQDITAQKNIEFENKNLQKQFQQAQKLESIGRLAGGVAHDFNNISSIVMGYSELALQTLNPTDPMHKNFTIIKDAAQKAANITRQLLAFARRQITEPKLLNMKEMMADLLQMLKRLVGENINIEYMPSPDTWSVKIDPSLFDQIMVNLCINARDAIDDTGKITIEISNISFDEVYCNKHMGFIPGDYVLLSVTDNGHGIPEEDIDKVFEPFYTTKGIGKGTGLGLSTVYGIVKQNKGFINIYSEQGSGTVIKIYLPRYSGEVEYSRRTEGDTIPTARGETVLLVEDDHDIQELIALFLDQLGYRVLSAGTPAAAIEKVKKHYGVIDLLITDVIMPEMNGRVLFEQLINNYPNLKALYMSGYTVNVIANKGVLKEGVFFLSKPFSQKELALKVREVLESV